MSEYQYYEFQAIDRPLTNEQMAELRAITSRAEITPTRLTNVYEWGDFKGDPVELLVTHFDAHLYEANWGTHTLMFGFPSNVVDLEQLQAYQVEAISDYESGLFVLARDDRVIVTFASSEEDGEEDSGWIDEEDSGAWLSSMITLRSDIVNGDLRALYLGWLAGATVNYYEDDDGEGDSDEIDDDELAEDGFENANLREPPIPPGLGQLTGPLKKLAEFLRLNPATIDVAAERSTPLTETRISESQIKAWIAKLPGSEKDDVLLRLIKGEPQLGAQLVRRLRTDLMPRPGASRSDEPRTAGQLARAGKERAAQAKRRASEKQARDRARHLDSLKGKEENLWRQAHDLVSTKRQHEYDEAVTLIRDLRDLAERSDKTIAFTDRLNELRIRHKGKSSFIDRLNRAGLR